MASANKVIVPVLCTVRHRQERDKLQVTLPSVTPLVELVLQHRNALFFFVARQVERIIAGVTAGMYIFRGKQKL